MRSSYRHYPYGRSGPWARLSALGEGSLDSPFIPLIGFGDTPSLDAFGRVRVSNPEYVFDAQLTYDLQPLLFEQITAESGAAIAQPLRNKLPITLDAVAPSGPTACWRSSRPASVARRTAACR